MPPKTKKQNYKKRPYRKNYKKNNLKSLSKAVKALSSKMNKTIETKQSNLTATDGVEIYHNNYTSVFNNLLATTNGTADEASGMGQRIGDRITLRGLLIKGMLELNERYANVLFRLVVLKSSKNDTPSRSTMFNGLSGNKMLDTFNSERYTIIASKYVKMEAPNTGNIYGNGAGGAPQPSGYADTIQATQTFSRATKLFKLWIPPSKLIKSGVLQYENGSQQPKFNDYHFLIYAYSNYTTLQDYWYVGRVNDVIATLYYKDA